MFRKIGIIISIVAICLAACGAAAPAPSVADQRSLSNAPAVAPAAEPTAVSATTGNGTDVKRLVIKNASLALSVDDPSKSSETISKMADELGGFVVSANIYQNSTSSGVKYLQASVTIRVPAEKLDEALTRIKAESTQPVISEKVTSEDVTAAYTDLQSRLRNAEAAELEMRGFLDTAKETDDLLNVYAQLKILREEIEVLKGQIQYYEQSAAFSLISVELRANAAEQPITVAGWQPVGIAKDAIQALIGTLQGLGGVAIWFILFCFPLLLIAGVPLGLVIFVIRRFTRKTKKQLPPKAPPPMDVPVA